MNQPEQTNLQSSLEPTANNVYSDIAAEAGSDKVASEREWLPEDDDDWYEPDYCRTDRRGS